MRLDERHAENERVIAHVRRARGRSDAPLVAAPSSHPDPWQGAGAHPDVVEHLWRTLNAALPRDARALVLGMPALVHPDAGVVLALAQGTSYALRVPDARVPDALARGCRAERERSTGERTDLAREIGPGWLFGAWNDAETAWLAETYEQLSDSGR